MLVQLGLAGFAAATLLGMWLSYVDIVCVAFGWVQLAMLGVVFPFGLRLLKHPNTRNARPFYTLGFATFLVPSLAQIFCKVHV